MAIQLEIEKIAYGGKGIGRFEGKVVFVPFSAPGDVVEVDLTAQKKGFSEGVIKRIIKPSAFRVEPVCPVYGVCGGCAMQHLSYDAQLSCKQAALEETLRRIGKLKDLPFEPPIAAIEPFNYRTRARFHVEHGRFGFYRVASHDIVDIDACPLIDRRLNDAITPIKKFVANVNKEKSVVLSVEISLMQGDGIAAVFTVDAKAASGLSGLFDTVPGLVGFEARSADTGKVVEFSGETVMSYEALGFTYKTPVNSFTQVNKSLNPRLIEKVLEYAALDKTKRVIDLYCGAGNLTIPAARAAKEAIGVENSRSSVKFAGINAAQNNVANALFYAADVSNWLGGGAPGGGDIKTLERGSGDVVILDPPREGDRDAARRIASKRPERVVYVSCAPPTLARDLEELVGNNYRVFSVLLIDMFPQTYHIESIVGLKRN